MRLLSSPFVTVEWQCGFLLVTLDITSIISVNESSQHYLSDYYLIPQDTFNLCYVECLLLNK